MKNLAVILLLLLVNGCAQNSVLLGPVFTGITSGSVSQAGISYGTSTVINKIRGKNEKEVNENPKVAFKQVKASIDKNSSIKNLANQ